MEIWDGYREDGTLAGIDLVRGGEIPEGIYHITCEVLVRHRDGDYLVMKRDPCKPINPGRYEASAGGSALKGEDSETCIKRELREETGIEAQNLKLVNMCHNRDTIYYSYICSADCDKNSIRLQKGETVGYKWLSESEFVKFVNSDEIIGTQKARYYDYFVSAGYLK